MGQSSSSPSSTRTIRQDNASTRTLHSASLNSHRPIGFFRRISNRLHVTHPTRRFGRNRTNHHHPNNNNNNNNNNINNNNRQHHNTQHTNSRLNSNRVRQHTSASSTTSSVRRATQEAARAAAAVTGPPHIASFILQQRPNNSSRNSITSSSDSTHTTQFLNDLFSYTNNEQQQQQQQSGNSFIQYLQIPLRMQEVNHDGATQSSVSSTASRRMHILVIEYRPNTPNTNTSVSQTPPSLNNDQMDIPLSPPPTYRFLGLRRPRSEVSTTSSTETIQSMPLSTMSTQTNMRTNNIHQQHQVQPPQQQDGQWIVYVMNNSSNSSGNTLQALSSSLILEDNPSYEDLLRLSNMLGQVRPSTTTQAAVEQAIPMTIWSDDTKKQVSHEQCLVCLDEFSLKQQVRILKCQHVFHRECVDRWLCEAHNSCPICRGVPV